MHNATRFLVSTALALSALTWLAPRDSQAYVWMNRHEYSGCAQCHADPSGGSLLTAYGRGQAEILLRTPYAGTPEEPGRVAQFMGGVITPDWLLLGGDVRELYLRMTVPGAPTITRWILMQADLQGQVTVGRLRANGSLGVLKDGALETTLIDREGWRPVSRAHWIGVDLGEDRQFLLRAGRINLPFGLRTIEHEMWVRGETRTDINAAQQHGLALAYSGAALRGELMLIAGNFQVHPDRARDRGYAGYAEVALAPRLGVGASSMITHTQHDPRLRTGLWRQAHGVFLRWAPARSVAFLAEGDLLFFSQPGGLDSYGYAVLAQQDLEPLQGLHLILTGELLRRDIEHDAGTSKRGWLSLAWFFAPHADIRLDAIWESLLAGSSFLSINTLLAQGHVYF